MKKTKHTPTPWKVEKTTSRHNFVIVGQRYIAEVFNHSSPSTTSEQYADIEKQLREEAEANAAFIVRACNNLEECKEAIQYAVDTFEANCDCGECYPCQSVEGFKALLTKLEEKEGKK